MIRPRWRTAFASVIGTSHARSGMPCQDAGRCQVITLPDGNEALLAVVSDGAGSAARSEAGAALAVQSFLEIFSAAAAADPSLGTIDRRFAGDWLNGFRQSIARLAASEGRDPHDFACTLLAAVIGTASSVYLQVGDGAIVVGTEEPGEYTWVVWPQHGEYANQTNFLTQDDAIERLAFETGPPVDEVAVFTDGIERLVLDMRTRSVHSPAFRPIFHWLAGLETNHPDAPSAPLTAYLGSDHVNGRTDDDKTLVMATRVRQNPRG